MLLWKADYLLNVQTFSVSTSSPKGNETGSNTGCFAMRQRKQTQVYYKFCANLHETIYRKNYKIWIYQPPNARGLKWRKNSVIQANKLSLSYFLSDLISLPWIMLVNNEQSFSLCFILHTIS